MAISYLYDTFKENFTTTNLYNLYVKDSLVEDELNVILGQIRTGFNSPYTSSCGRLFDGVSSILGQRQICTYEGQAAIELESLSESDEHDVLPYEIDCHNGLIEIDCRPMFCEIENLLNLNTGVNKIAKMFHNTIVVQVIDVCLRVMKSTGVKKVALGGGVMQNRLILRGLLDGLRASGFEGYVCRYAPLSDGGISLGQAAYAQSLLEG
jgi:hydrogenase maturation protein HypF